MGSPKKRDPSPTRQVYKLGDFTPASSNYIRKDYPRMKLTDAVVGRVDIQILRGLAKQLNVKKLVTGQGVTANVICKYILEREREILRIKALIKKKNDPAAKVIPSPKPKPSIWEDPAKKKDLAKELPSPSKINDPAKELPSPSKESPSTKKAIVKESPSPKKDPLPKKDPESPKKDPSTIQGASPKKVASPNKSLSPKKIASPKKIPSPKKESSPGNDPVKEFIPPTKPKVPPESKPKESTGVPPLPKAIPPLPAVTTKVSPTVPSSPIQPVEIPTIPNLSVVEIPSADKIVSSSESKPPNTESTLDPNYVLNNVVQPASTDRAMGPKLDLKKPAFSMQQVNEMIKNTVMVSMEQMRQEMLESRTYQANDASDSSALDTHFGSSALDTHLSFGYPSEIIDPDAEECDEDGALGPDSRMLPPSKNINNSKENANSILLGSSPRSNSKSSNQRKIIDEEQEISAEIERLNTLLQEKTRKRAREDQEKSISPKNLKKQRQKYRRNKKKLALKMLLGESNSDVTEAESYSDGEKKKSEKKFAPRIASDEELKVAWQTGDFSRLPRGIRPDNKAPEYSIPQLESSEDQEKVKVWYSKILSAAQNNMYELVFLQCMSKEPEKLEQGKLALWKSPRLAQSFNALKDAVIASLTDIGLNKNIDARILNKSLLPDAWSIIHDIQDRANILDCSSDVRAKNDFNRYSWNTSGKSLSGWFAESVNLCSKLPPNWLPLSTELLRNKVYHNINSKAGSNTGQIDQILNIWREHPANAPESQENQEYSNDKLVTRLQRAMDTQSTLPSEKHATIFGAWVNYGNSQSDLDSVFFLSESSNAKHSPEKIIKLKTRNNTRRQNNKDRAEERKKKESDKLLQDAFMAGVKKQDQYNNNNNNNNGNTNNSPDPAKALYQGNHKPNWKHGKDWGQYGSKFCETCYKYYNDLKNSDDPNKAKVIASHHQNDCNWGKKTGGGGGNNSFKGGGSTSSKKGNNVRKKGDKDENKNTKGGNNNKNNNKNKGGNGKAGNGKGGKHPYKKKG